MLMQVVHLVTIALYRIRDTIIINFVKTYLVIQQYICKCCIKGIEAQLYSFRTWALEWSDSPLGSFTPVETLQQYPLNIRVDGSQNGSELFGIENNIFLCQESNYDPSVILRNRGLILHLFQEYIFKMWTFNIRRFRPSQVLCLRLHALRGNRTRGVSFRTIHICAPQNFRSCCC